MVEIESIGFLLDRLVIANIKINRWTSEGADGIKVASTDKERIALRESIDRKLIESIRSGEYHYHVEERTYPITPEKLLGDGIGDILERLITANLNLSNWNHAVIEEEKKENPDLKKMLDLDRNLRATNEDRVAAKNAIDKKLKELIEKSR